MCGLTNQAISPWSKRPGSVGSHERLHMCYREWGTSGERSGGGSGSTQGTNVGGLASQQLQDFFFQPQPSLLAPCITAH